MLLQVRDQRPRVAGILAQLLDQLIEGFLLRLQPLDTDDQVTEWNQVATKPRRVIAGIGGIDLELLHCRQLRPEPRRDCDDGVVVGVETTRSVEVVHLELHVAELGERLGQRVGQVLLTGRPGGDQGQLLVAAVGGVGRLTGGCQE